MDAFIRDFRYALRSLARSPGFTFTVMLTLALGIGANGVLFALIDRVLLRDLPLPDPDRLVTVWERTKTTPEGQVSPLNLADWMRRSKSFAAFGGFIPNTGSMVMSGPDGAETVSRQWVTTGIFEALGIAPIVGRTFNDADDVAGANVAVLSEAYWRSRFASDPGIVGQSIRFDGEPYTIVGVVPRQADLLAPVSMWASASIQGLPERARASYWLQTVGRLKPGVSLEAARDDLARIAVDLAREYPATNAGRGVTLVPLRDVVLGADLKRTSLLFLGVAGFVLLICFANIANLLLTRNAARGNELAIRSVLGADRRRLVRQFATENFLLAAAGGLAGMILAGALLRIVPAAIPRDLLPAGFALDLDWRVSGYCAGASLLVAALFTLASGRQAAGIASLREGMPSGRGVTDRSTRTRETLVVAQVATAAVLLYGAGLLTRTLIEVNTVEPGYHAPSVLSMIVDPLADSYPTPEALLQFYGAIEEELKSIPGLASAAWTSSLPLGNSMTARLFYDVAGESPFVPSERPTADMHVVSSRYFHTLELPILAGRAFDERDRIGSAPVCIVNEAFVERRLRGGPAIGRSAQVWQAEDSTEAPRTCEIVGIAANTKRRADEPETPTQIYFPFARIPSDDVFLVVRPGSGDASALAPQVRAAIARVDRESLVSVTDIATLDGIAYEATARYRFRALLIAAFAGLALVLAALGLFGVLAYSVQRRWREYGLRMALGARANSIIGLIARGTARLLLAGVLIGSMLALGLGQLLDAMLFGVRPFDPATFTLVIAALAATAAMSVAVPALRASGIDPMQALREE